MNEKYVEYDTSKIIDFLENKFKYFKKENEKNNLVDEDMKKFDLSKKDDLLMLTCLSMWSAMVHEFEGIYLFLDVLFRNISVEDFTLKKDLEEIKKTIKPYNNEGIRWVLEELNQRLIEKEKNIDEKGE